MAVSLLEKIHSPADLKGFDYLQLEKLCGEIRSFLIENVSKTGGHLSSNLGTVELTVALHYALHSPQDMLVFDVGHQCYTHKLLTGRREGFSKLRQAGGISGFPAPPESEHDIFVAGHGSTSISAAIGLARAKKLKQEPGLVVAIIGDGAFTGGMPYEAINNVEGLDNLVVILNDNKMSISKNDGGLGKYLSRLRSSPQYYKAKHDVKTVLDHTPLIGKGLVKSIRTLKSGLRRSIYHSTFFEEMGFTYIGPLDGHDLSQLCTLFSTLEQIDKPLFLHLETVKGRGYRPAEQNPGAFHGVTAFDVRHIADPDDSPKDSFSTVFGRALCDCALEDERICAITAAMKYGTGLQYFKKSIRSRFFDVGMAEEHAVTFSAGLARNGMVPVVCIYSTFLQRAYDQLIHDVSLQQLNVLFAVDRAGLVPGDGETHQGIYDAAYLSQQSGMPVFSVSNYKELTYWLGRLLEEYECPRALRYPRGTEPARLAEKTCTGQLYDVLTNMNKAEVALVTYGVETEQALEAADLLAGREIDAQVFQLLQINPIPPGLVEALLSFSTILFAEEGIMQGGIGEHLSAQLMRAGYKGAFIHKATPEIGIDHASVGDLKAQYGLDGAGLALAVCRALGDA